MHVEGSRLTSLLQEAAAVLLIFVGAT